MVIRRQRRHAIYLLSWGKPLAVTSSSDIVGQSSGGTTSLIASLSCNSASRSSTDQTLMSYCHRQSGTLCPELPQRKQVGESGFLLQFASMSIGTGCPGVGLTCACVGRGRGAD